MALTYGTRTLRRSAPEEAVVAGDLCVVGAGIAGISAALEASLLGRKVVLVDAAPALGGQSVGAMIGTFAGLFGNGPAPEQLTHGIADDILRDLGDAGDLHVMTGRRNTAIVLGRVKTL